MKGRRKLKTAKWRMKAKFLAEARMILQSEDHLRRVGKFLSIAVASTDAREPLGVLAGARHARATN